MAHDSVLVFVNQFEELLIVRGYILGVFFVPVKAVHFAFGINALLRSEEIRHTLPELRVLLDDPILILAVFGDAAKRRVAVIEVLYPDGLSRVEVWLFIEDNDGSS
jgi:hypothetical protein